MKEMFRKLFVKPVIVGGMLAGLVVLCQDTLAQQQTPAEGHIIPPTAEKFISASQLIVPSGRVPGTCHSGTPNPKPKCPTLTVAEWQASHLLTIFDSAGSVWYQFSISSRDPRYYLDSQELSFKPLGPEIQYHQNKVVHYPQLVILRLVGESPNWYEVEINEETEETRFVAKNDPLWAKVEWSDIFNMSFTVLIDSSRMKVLDKPNGKPLSECAEEARHQLVFTKLDGDWMFVNGKTPSDPKCMGWIRWRSGRDILVGSILNGRRLPERKTVEMP